MYFNIAIIEYHEITLESTMHDAHTKRKTY